MMAEARPLKVPSILIMKCHTTALFRDDLTIYDPGQPFALEIATMLIDEEGRSGNINSNLIRVDDRVTQEGALAVHGLTKQITAKMGVPESRVLGLLSDLLKTLPYRHMKVVAFHEFDHKVISSLFARLGDQMTPKKDFSNLWMARPQTEFLFLQDPWARLECKIPDPDGGYRKPSLQEAERIILGRDRTDGIFKDLPMALLDVLAIRDLYLHLNAKGLFHTTDVAA